MSFGKATENKSVKDSLRAVFAGLLLVFYAAGNIQVEVLHQFFHSHANAVVHSAEQEKDRCHRAIYHEKDDGCGHKSHLTKVEKCGLCHLFAHNDQLTIADSSCEFIGSNSAISKNLISVQLTDVTGHLPSRAPPVI
jgi:hypothetical protein